MSRPKITPEIIAAAVKSLAASHRWDDESCDDIVQACSKCFGDWDGYRIARELDDWIGWEVDAEIVESLDGVGSAIRHEHERVCWEWVRANDIQPTLPIGTITQFGEITGIYEHSPACYLIRRPTNTDNSRQIVKFEDAVAVEVAP